MAPWQQPSKASTHCEKGSAIVGEFLNICQMWQVSAHKTHSAMHNLAYKPAQTQCVSASSLFVAKSLAAGRIARPGRHVDVTHKPN